MPSYWSALRPWSIPIGQFGRVQLCTHIHTYIQRSHPHVHVSYPNRKSEMDRVLLVKSTCIDAHLHTYTHTQITDIFASTYGQKSLIVIEVTAKMSSGPV